MMKIINVLRQSLSVATTMMQQVQSKICIIQPTQAAAISFSCSTPICTQAKQNVVCCCSRKAAAHWWLAQLGRNASAYCHSTVITNNHYCETRVHTHPFWTTSKMWYHSTHTYWNQEIFLCFLLELGTFLQRSTHSKIYLEFIFNNYGFSRQN